MHPRRQLPHRLTLCRAASVALLIACSGCASSRYVGSIGATGVYGNLGYGLTLNLHAHELSARWKLIDPDDVDAVPPADRPEDINGPLDLDGDGELAPRETTRHLHPTLRLLARSSSAAGARIDIDVIILGGAEAERPIDDVAALALHELVGPTVTATAWVPSRVSPGFHARTAEGRANTGAYRLTVIDQVGFQGEAAAQPRRQSVRVLLVAPEITVALRSDFEALVSALSLAAQGGPVGSRDRW